MTLKINELVNKIKSNSVKFEDMSVVKEIRLSELRNVLESNLTHKILFRKGKEIGFAVSRKGHVYENCVFLTYEFDNIISFNITEWVKHEPSNFDGSLYVSAGPTIAIIHLPDGWIEKSYEAATGILTRQLIQVRGWLG